MAENQKSQFAQIEERILDIWEKERTFEKSVQNREGKPRYNFNDGPPFANGQPHFGHSLVTAIKDSMLRYKTMRGYYVPRRNGWDCHGLPVEYAIEKEFGISGKKQIEQLGIHKFNEACRASIFRYKADWETFLKRIGRWSDYDNYYATVDRDYTESVWWILSEINKKGLLYKGLKSTPYCPRCETPLSNFELNEGYRDNVPDPSVFALFPLKDDPKTQLLAWTTTPWTLPANAALAVDKNADYAYVKLNSGDSALVLAKERLEVLDLRGSDYSVLKTVKGSELLGLAYEPLYPLPESGFTAEQVANAHKVYHEDSVSLEDGTGILHVAPRYGEADLELGLQQKLPLIESVDSSGHVIYGPQPALGKFFKDADREIIADLTHKDRLFAAETFTHTYPFCWRCDTPLMYFATTTWFVGVSNTRDRLLAAAEPINWVPANIKTGRFGKWLEGARDWAISRNRYWGAPLPIWVNTENDGDYIVISSIDKLKQLAGPDIKVDDLHRPFIDEISFQKDGKTYKRVEEVLDCWFESGSMPAAQWHYPFENKEETEKLLSADFVTEGLDQTRLWFYVQHVISTTMFENPAFFNVIVNGIIMAADGQKLSKRLKNYPPLDDVFTKEGADSLRLYFLSSTQATETADHIRFRREAVTDLQRNVLGTLLNSFRFFNTYAELDKWQPQNLDRPASDNLLDKWIMARLDEVIAASTKSADDYKIAHAIEPIIKFIDDLSNWYIRRSRRRFWKSESDEDKNQAYATLYYSLMRTVQLLAPWAPFLSDYLWRELRAGNMPESVHLSDWPSVNQPDTASQKILDEMFIVRNFIADGLSQRAQAKIKIRQPLSSVTLFVHDREVAPDLREVIAGELNVKEVRLSTGKDEVLPHLEIDTNITPDLKAEGIARELIRNIQSARKKAGFNVEDRILMGFESPSGELTDAFEKFKELIQAEVLAKGDLENKSEADYHQEISLEGQSATIWLKKA